jgi:hypothetical protein
MKAKPDGPGISSGCLDPELPSRYWKPRALKADVDCGTSDFFEIDWSGADPQDKANCWWWRALKNYEIGHKTHTKLVWRNGEEPRLAKLWRTRNQHAIFRYELVVRAFRRSFPRWPDTREPGRGFILSCMASGAPEPTGALTDAMGNPPHGHCTLPPKFAFNLSIDDATLTRVFLDVINRERIRQRIEPQLRRAGFPKGMRKPCGPPAWASLETLDGAKPKGRPRGKNRTLSGNEQKIRETSQAIARLNHKTRARLRIEAKRWLRPFDSNAKVFEYFLCKTSLSPLRL